MGLPLLTCKQPTRKAFIANHLSKRLDLTIFIRLVENRDIQRQHFADRSYCRVGLRMGARNASACFMATSSIASG